MAETNVRDVKEKASVAAKAAGATVREAVRQPAATPAEGFREVTEAGAERARLAYDAYRRAAEEANGVLEEMLASVSKGTNALQTQALSAARANVDAGFDLLDKLLKAKTLAEALELQTSFARQQFEAFGAQARELQALSTQVQDEATRPLKSNVGRAMAQWRAAF